MIFSDECRLEAVTECHRFVRWRPNERYNEECIVKNVKHPSSVMIWGCISELGPGPLYFVDGTMRQDQYQHVLKQCLIPYIHSLPHPSSFYTFMQDGAPCHTAKSVTKFLNSCNIDILPWAGNSPDMNPIENCWSTLKSIVYKSS